MTKDIPEISLQRLPVYLNYLKSLSDDVKYISSGAIAAALGMGEVLVRKDLAYTSSAGRPKVGYVRAELVVALEEFLGCNIKKNAVLVGAGGLGRALLAYGGFSNYGIEIVEAYDADPSKAGVVVGGKTIYPAAEMVSRIADCRPCVCGAGGVRRVGFGGRKGHFKLCPRAALRARRRGCAPYRCGCKYGHTLQPAVIVKAHFSQIKFN